MRFAYADPPYYGMGEKMYGYPEWDSYDRHDGQLLVELYQDYPDGWAMSCNPRDLRPLLGIAVEIAWDYEVDEPRVCAWTKTYHQIRPTSVQYAWEPVLLYGGRSIKGRNPMVRDWYSAGATKQKAVQGAKPYGFCRWVLDLLGYDPAQDELVDLFPGSGIMGYVSAQGVLA